MRGRVIRIQRNRALKFLDRAGEIQTIRAPSECEGCVRFGQSIVDLDSPLRGRLG